jgi:hypothetical protein
MKRSIKLLVIVATAVSTVAFAGAGWALWTTTGTGIASAAARTLATPVISTPITATGNTVSLNWTAVAPPGGADSVSYYVLRDNAAASTACGSSASPITGSSCNDTGVPNGLHSYTVMANFQSWKATSAPASVTVNGDTTPPTVTITKVNLAVVAFPFSTNANITSIAGSCGTATGDIATVTVAISTQNGTAACNAGAWSWPLVTTISAPGSYTATATQVDAAGNTGTSGSQTITIDKTAPTVTINQAAAQADPTNAAPINYTVVFSESVTGFTNADVTLTGTAGGSKAIAISGGPTTYNVAVSGATGNGTVIATVPVNAAQDTALNNNSASTSTDNSVTLDTTAPAASSVSTTNKTPSGSAGKPEAGDTVTLTYSEAMNPGSMLSGWNGSSTNVVVRITDGNATNSLNDKLTVWDASNTNQVALGTIDLASRNYVTGDVSFSASTITLSGAGALTITLGTVSDITKIGTDSGNTKLSWAPSSAATDLAGNAASVTPKVSGNVTQF